MSKRGPTSELNHENWDEEDSEDEKGVKEGFQQAAPEELQKRVIKVAKRRSTNPSTPVSSPFNAFKGFQTSKSPTSATPTFTFVTEGMKNGHAEGEGTKKEDEKMVQTKPSEEKEVPKVSTSKPFDDFVKPSTKGLPQTPKADNNKSDNLDSSPDYYSHLKSLNLSMASWITKHLNDNPYCILLPVFRDYEKHLDNISKNYPLSNSDDDMPAAPERKEIPKIDPKPTKLEETKPTTKLFPSVTKSDSSSDTDATAEPASKQTSLFASVASSPTSSTSSSTSSLLFKLPSSSDSLKSGTSNKSEKTSPDSPNTSTVSKAPLEKFFTPMTQTPAAKAVSPNFQTPAVTTPSLFENLKSGSFFGGTTTAAENKTFNPSSLTFSFGTTTSTSSTETSKSTFGSVFGSTSAPGFAFGSSAKPPLSGFGSGTTGGLFGGPPAGGTMFSFGSHNTQEQAKKEDDDGDSEEPPKVEFNPIKEDDAVFEVTCKVYVRKDGEYKDRGKGQLYIKKVAGGKSQLLARAATTTGQILLNVILNSSVTVSKPASGKNSVIIMCIPLPNEQPTAVLVRVKTEADADELLAKLEEYKQPAAEADPEK